MWSRKRKEYVTVKDLQNILDSCKLRLSHVDEVWPNIYIGNVYAAKNKRNLQAHGISHVLNAAHGKFNIDTGATFYHDVNLEYHGVEAYDMVTFDLSAFFYKSADFIRSVLNLPTGRVLVHCAMGLSRSSTLVLAYLMIHEKMTLAKAIAAVGANRNIKPNAGFLEKLRALDVELQPIRLKTMLDDDHVTPSCYELDKILNRGCAAYVPYNEVWPQVYIGDEATAKDKFNLQKLGITHVLNAAEGTWNNVDTGAGYYGDMGVVYHGVVAADTPTFDLSQYFLTAARFIRTALADANNKILVHCVMGRSRSATLFLAYLMICEGMMLADAVEHVKTRRRILPNWGFLKQLRELDAKLQDQRRKGARCISSECPDDI
ncbi:uncharacterized protein LOC144093135 [Stigmatopora argus]